MFGVQKFGACPGEEARADCQSATQQAASLRYGETARDSVVGAAKLKSCSRGESFAECNSATRQIKNLRYGGAERASVLVIVLLIAFGLVSIAIYFANSMTMELRASDNRVSGMAADQTIEGAARYISSVLGSYATNGATPQPGEFNVEAVPVGQSSVPQENARFWIIGRDTNMVANSLGTTRAPFFGLVDESSKLDLNAKWLTVDVLQTNFPNMTADFAEAIMDWRDTNGNASLNYSQAGYTAKHAPFETVGELRMVYGATKDLLVGEDINRNGVLDGNEEDLNGNNQADGGVLEYFTVYSRASECSQRRNANDQRKYASRYRGFAGRSSGFVARPSDFTESDRRRWRGAGRWRHRRRDAIIKELIGFLHYEPDDGG